MNTGSGQGFLHLQDIAYLFLVASIWTGTFSIASPGTGLLEIAACVLIFIAALAAVLLPVNFWALAILAAGLAVFLLEVFRPSRGIFLLVSVVLFTVGSIFLYGGPNNEWAGVSWQVAVTASAASTAFFWMVIRKTLQARLTPHQMDPSLIVGQSGEAQTDILESGSVQVASELWSASSVEHIPSGSRVRILDRKGLMLIVQKEE